MRYGYRTRFGDGGTNGILIVVEGSSVAARPAYATEMSLATEWHRELDMFNELVLERVLVGMLAGYAVSTEFMPADSSATAPRYPLIWTLPSLACPAPAELSRLYDALDDTCDAVALLDTLDTLDTLDNDGVTELRQALRIDDDTTRLRQSLHVHRKLIEVEIAALEFPLNLESMARGPLSWLTVLRRVMDYLTFAEAELCEYLFRRSGLGRSDREGWLWPHDFGAAVSLMLHESNRLRVDGKAYHNAMHLLLDTVEQAPSA